METIDLLCTVAIALNIVNTIYVYITLKSRILWLEIKINRLEDEINRERIVLLGSKEKR